MEGVYCRHCIDESSSEDEADSIFVAPAVKEKVATTEKEKAATIEKEEQAMPKTQMEVEMQPTTNVKSSQENASFASSPYENDNQPEQEMNINSNSSPCVLGALMWLNTKLLLNDFKKYIIAVLALAIWIVLCIAYSTLSVQEKCADGSYSLTWSCIDNDNPPYWNPNHDAALMVCSCVIAP